MTELTEDVKDFLSHGTRTAKLGYLAKDGRPLIAPVWFVVDGQPIPADVYRPDDHRVVAEAGDLPDGVEVLGITEEPIGGSTAPTGPMLLSATA